MSQEAAHLTQVITLTTKGLDVKGEGDWKAGAGWPKRREG